VRPNVDFKTYKRVQLDPVQVAMDKNWDPNSEKVGLSGTLSSTDVRRIRDELSKMFRDVFAERLSKNGYPLVETSGDDVLLVQAALTNVYINAPDDADSRTRSYVMDAGRMTLVMQLADSVTGQTLARVVDTKQGSNTRGPQWANSVTNSAEARKAIGQWADALSKALDAVNGRAAGSDAAPAVTARAREGQSTIVSSRVASSWSENIVRSRGRSGKAMIATSPARELRPKGKGMIDWTTA